MNAAGAAPVPVSATDAESPAGSVAWSVAVIAPVVVGAKAASTVHLAPAVSGPVQPSFESLNWSAFVPTRATVIAPVAPTAFWSVNVVAADVDPGATAPKSCVEVVKESAPCWAPVPDRVTSSAPPGCPVTVRSAVDAPGAVGAKCAATEHCAWGARAIPVHASVSMANDAAAAPGEGDDEGSGRASPPVLVTTRVMAGAVLPTSTSPKASARRARAQQGVRAALRAVEAAGVEARDAGARAEVARSERHERHGGCGEPRKLHVEPLQKGVP